jgi:poly-gamma-glutamate capsule biosynthesis protein CapA/YwtB (metallophosphatase superfamily)
VVLPRHGPSALKGAEDPGSDSDRIARWSQPEYREAQRVNASALSREDRRASGRSAGWLRRGLFYFAVMAFLAGVSALALQRPSSGAPISLTFVGDVMLGRGVAPVASGDPMGVFGEVRWILSSSDLVMGNLESPLTTRSHRSPNPHALGADPATAFLLAAAGFDVLSLANNHSGDAGPSGIVDTIEAVEAAGMRGVGAGVDLSAAATPLMIEVGGIRVAVLAFDATGAGLAAGADPGVAPWDEESAREATERAARRSDLVIVSLHGGVEYLPESDPRMLGLARNVSSWGADVVWGHGSHVVQPLVVARGDRPSLVATSLGNFIFDQRGPLTGSGAVLQVLADRSGVIGFRLGATSHVDLRVRWLGWQLPKGDAALIEGEWWSLVREMEPVAKPAPSIEHFEWGTVVAASSGRITSDGLETVVSFRHVSGPHPVRDGFPEVQWVDASGMTPHLGIYRASDLAPIWVAGMVPAPVAEVAACDGSLALAYSEFDDPQVVATAGAVWRPFGLDAAARLPGAGRPGCADVDGDGLTEPVILGRGASG